MGYTYNPTEFPTFDIDIVGEDGTVVTHKVPTLGYIPRSVVEELDAEMTERFSKIAAERKKRATKGTPMPDSDATVAYPTQLDWLEAAMRKLNPDVAAKVATWPLRPREDLWLAWEKESAPVTVEKSDASSNSSDEDE